MATAWRLQDFIFGCDNLNDEEKKLCYDVLHGEGFEDPTKREAFLALTDAELQALGIRRMATRKALQMAMAAGAAATTSTAAVASAAGLGVQSAAGVDMATLRQVAREAAQAALEAQAAPRKPKPFSSVGNTEAVQFLADLNLAQIDGNALFAGEVQLPDQMPEISGFDMSGYKTENEATGALLEHHKKQLTLLGVRFGRSGFDIYNVRSFTNDALLIKKGNKAFSGIFDGLIAPYGLGRTYSMRQCRIVYEHKKPEALDGSQGQAILELLAACAYGPCPVLVDLTDGMRHIVYTIRGREVISWTELTPKQAYYLQAQHLMSSEFLAKRTLTVDQIPEEEQEWMRPVHQLRPESGLLEQLESTIPFLPPDERVDTALELIHAWTQAQQPAPPMQLPDSIQAFYA